MAPKTPVKALTTPRKPSPSPSNVSVSTDCLYMGVVGGQEIPVYTIPPQDPVGTHTGSARPKATAQAKNGTSSPGKQQSYYDQYRPKKPQKAPEPGSYYELYRPGHKATKSAPVTADWLQKSATSPRPQSTASSSSAGTLSSVSTIKPSPSTVSASSSPRGRGMIRVVVRDKAPSSPTIRPAPSVVPSVSVASSVVTSSSAASSLTSISTATTTSIATERPTYEKGELATPTGSVIQTTIHARSKPAALRSEAEKKLVTAYPLPIIPGPSRSAPATPRRSAEKERIVEKQAEAEAERERPKGPRVSRAVLYAAGVSEREFQKQMEKKAKRERDG